MANVFNIMWLKFYMKYQQVILTAAGICPQLKAIYQNEI